MQFIIGKEIEDTHTSS